MGELKEWLKKQISSGLRFLFLLLIIFLSSFFLLSSIRRVYNYNRDGFSYKYNGFGSTYEKILELESKHDYALMIGSQEIGWDTIKGVLFFDKEVSLVFNRSFQDLASSDEEYLKEVVKRITRREAIKKVAGEYGLGGPLTEKEKEYLQNSFLSSESLMRESSKKERLERVRKISFENRLRGQETVVDFIFYFVKTYGSSARYLESEEKNPKEIAEQKANKVCQLARDGASLEEVREFMSKDEMIMFLNRNGLPNAVFDKSMSDVGGDIVGFQEELLSLKRGELGEVRLFKIKEDYGGEKGVEDFSFGCIKLIDISKDQVVDWKGKVDTYIDELIIENHLYE